MRAAMVAASGVGTQGQAGGLGALRRGRRRSSCELAREYCVRGRCSCGRPHAHSASPRLPGRIASFRDCDKGFPRLSTCARRRTLPRHARLPPRGHRHRSALRHLAVVLRQQRGGRPDALVGAADGRHRPADDRGAARLHPRYARVFAQRPGRPLCGEPDLRRVRGARRRGQRRLCAPRARPGRRPGGRACESHPRAALKGASGWRARALHWWPTCCQPARKTGHWPK